MLDYQADLAGGGSIGNNLLILSVAVGVGFFVAMGILRILLGIPIAYLLTVGYLIIGVVHLLNKSADQGKEKSGGN